MQALSLVGKWKLIRDGSDFMPGLDDLKCSPMVLKLLGKADTEFLKIEKLKTFGVDEVGLTYVTKSLSVGKRYQLGTLNFEASSGVADAVFAVVQNCNEKFTHFAVHRLGPASGQMSREAYTYDSANDEVKLEIEVNSGDGLHVKLIKYLARFDQSQVSQEVAFSSCPMSQGWAKYPAWPASVLAECKAQIVKAVKIITCNAKTMQDSKVLDVVWTRTGFTDDFKLNLAALTRTQALRQHDGEEVVIYCVQVTMGGASWFVAHRYTEFSVMKNFLLRQNPQVKELRDVEASFPGKAWGVAFRKSVLERRIEGLGAFLVFFLQRGLLCRQTSIDALLSFLEIPEHMATLVKPPPAPRGIPSGAVGAAGPAASGAPAAPGGGAAPRPGLPTASSTSSGTLGGENPGAQALWALLGKKGMEVIKHGRQGAPKTRVLHCSPDGTLLYWRDKQADKSIYLDEVRAIRLGLDIDPATPPHLIPSSASGKQAAADRVKRGLGRANSMKSGILYGTETLRRNCKMEDLALCFSLILPTRTFDIQCKNQQDMDKLLAALRAVCPAVAPEFS